MTNVIEGKTKSGLARAAALTKERRIEIATKASHSRFDKSIPKVISGNKNTSLRIGNMDIPCYVLDSGARVIVPHNLGITLGLTSGGDRVTKFINNKNIHEFITSQLSERIHNPIKFKNPRGAIVNGYDALMLIDICTSVLEAKDKNSLSNVESRVAKQCEIIIRSVAKVGIIALIDEVTGYQIEREKNALSQILEKFITKELQPWIKTFPLDYYKELGRLKQITLTEGNMPSYIGNITNDIVYKRLSPGILQELKAKTPKNKNGQKTAKFFQCLTKDIGYNKLREHLGSVITIMKLSNDYSDFIQTLDKIHPTFFHGKLEKLIKN